MTKFLLSLSVLTVLVFFPAIASGQGYRYRARTAEYMTGSSDLVVRATIVELKYRKHDPKIDKGTADWAQMLLRVDRCLKGSTDNSIRLSKPVRAPHSRLEAWHKEGTSVFWFLNQSKPNEAGISNFKLRTEKGRSIYATVEPPETKKEHPTILLLDAVDWQPLATSEKLEQNIIKHAGACLLYTSPSPRDATLSRMPSSA